MEKEEFEVEVSYSDDILINEEFTRVAGEWAEFDEVEVLG
jgi:hypothetical protein